MMPYHHKALRHTTDVQTITPSALPNAIIRYGLKQDDLCVVWKRCVCVCVHAHVVIPRSSLPLGGQVLIHAERDSVHAGVHAANLISQQRAHIYTALRQQEASGPYQIHSTTTTFTCSSAISDNKHTHLVPALLAGQVLAHEAVQVGGRGLDHHAQTQRWTCRVSGGQAAGVGAVAAPFVSLQAFSRRRCCPLLACSCPCLHALCAQEKRVAINEVRQLKATFAPALLPPLGAGAAAFSLVAAAPCMQQLCGHAQVWPSKICVNSWVHLTRNTRAANPSDLRMTLSGVAAEVGLHVTETCLRDLKRPTTTASANCLHDLEHPKPAMACVVPFHQMPAS
eukprot:1158389-Pelagomonas_calceolata.AAC.2